MDHLSLTFTFLTLYFSIFLFYHHQCLALGKKLPPFIGREGQWQLLKNNTGVVAMHMALTHENTVLIFDQTESGPTGYRLTRRANGNRCLRDDVLDPTCYAHSIEYLIESNTLRPLIRVPANMYSSSGTFLRNGTLLQTGGYSTGFKKIGFFHPCEYNLKCDWQLSNQKLFDNRWYASSQLLPSLRSDRVIVVGGNRVFSYEFVPKRSHKETSFSLPFLHQTFNKDEGGSNLYPFLHLSSDGHLFIFANRDSILFDYRRNRVVKVYPRIPGSGSRNYPSSGSSVILPLEHNDQFTKVEVMVCGGSPERAHSAAKVGRFLKALQTCGRMEITGNHSQWKMEEMPRPRVMMDMVILPTGNILLINGAESGVAGRNNANNPATTPWLYRVRKPLGKRFLALKTTNIPRMYPSSAVLLPDGRVLVGGGNPNLVRYRYHNVTYPTELRLQAFAPQYTDQRFHRARPTNISIEDGDGITIKHNQSFLVQFRVANKPSTLLEFNIYSPPFTTHSVGMNQRMLKLKCTRLIKGDGGLITAMVEAPPLTKVAPSGYYLLFVVNDGIPSRGQWVLLVPS